MFTFPCGSRGALVDLTWVQGLIVSTRIIRIHIGPLREPMLAQDAAYVSALKAITKIHHKKSSLLLYTKSLPYNPPIHSLL